MSCLQINDVTIKSPEGSILADHSAKWTTVNFDIHVQTQIQLYFTQARALIFI